MMKGSYLGPEFSDMDIIRAAKRHKAVYTGYPDFDALCATVAELLDRGNVVGWFQDRMEFGPRALGNRSIVADARNPEMQKKLNLKIKFREGFRPFAPSVLAEDSAEFFDTHTPSPYMLLVADVREARRKTLPADYHSLPWRDKLYYLRSDVPAITHIDYTARLQTVHKETNPKYRRLIERFKERTGCGVIINLIIPCSLLQGQAVYLLCGSGHRKSKEGLSLCMADSLPHRIPGKVPQSLVGR
jgi:carbamoyltransferase